MCFWSQSGENSISETIIISKLFLRCLPHKHLQVSNFRGIELSLKTDGSCISASQTRVSESHSFEFEQKCSVNKLWQS